MKDERSRLRRVKLIERLRSAEHQQAAAAAFHAEAVRQKLESLSERTRSLAQLYAIRDHARDGADLRGATLLGAHLNELGKAAEQQAYQARNEADSKFAELAIADRKKQRAEADRKDLHRTILDRAVRVDSVGPRKSGTHLE